MPCLLRRGLAVALAAAVLTAVPGRVLASAAILDLSIEELMSLRVTSVAKRDQRLSEAAAAVFVITRDDLRRSGVTALPEALRLAPGVTVGRINGGQWAISARGFASRFGNKLLVLVDGRSIYTPLFSGVLWDAHDLMLEDIERIEVIRGPGASLWGANAVNGVINIITRSAAETTGALVSVIAGDVDRGIVEARHGAALDRNAFVRGWVRAGDRDDSPPVGHDGEDGWRRARGGLRYDATEGALRTMLTAEAYGSRVEDATRLGVLAPPYFRVSRSPFENHGVYAVGSWQRTLGPHAQLALQAWAEFGEVHYLGVNERHTTLDIELQHRFRAAPAHDVTWGVGFRSYDSRIASPDWLVLPSDRYNLATAFVQDEVALLDGRVHVTVGFRLEHNSFTGFELQPNLRAAWTPAPGHTVWGALSRAVRTPEIVSDRGEVMLTVLPPGTPQNPSPLPTGVIYRGDGSLSSETLVAAELGWRGQVDPVLAVDVALYAHRYRDLVAQMPGSPVLQPLPVPHFEVPLLQGNTGGRTIRGFEGVVDWRPSPGVRVRGTYTLQSGAENPRHQASLRPSVDLGRNVELDLWLRYVDSLANASGDRIAAYTELDLRLAWRPQPGVEVALVGQNLLHRAHEEFRSDILGTLPMEVPRAFYVKLRYAF